MSQTVSAPINFIENLYDSHFAARCSNGEQETLDVIYRSLETWTRELGFSHFMFRLSLDPNGDGQKVSLIHNYPSMWTKYYRDHRQYKIDPIVRHCQQHSSPIFWDEAARPLDVNEDEFARFTGMARASGIQHGVSFPMHGPFGEWGILNLNCSRPLSRDGQHAAQIITSGKLYCAQMQDFIRQMFKSKSGPVKFDSLTQRQKECLLWSIEGKTAWETSKILGISERTVVYHIQNCFNTLNVLNRTQAAARAYSYLRSDLGFMYEDVNNSSATMEYCGG